MGNRRQKILILYLDNSALDSKVLAWSQYDGTGKLHPTSGDSDSPPYESGLDALIHGWRVIQFPQLIPSAPGAEYSTSFMQFEYIFEKLEAT